jgi:hypothetical protein
MNENGWEEGRWGAFPPGGGGSAAPSVAASGGMPSDDGFDDVFHPSRHEGLLENGQTLTLVKDPFVFKQEPLCNEEKKVDEETKRDETADRLGNVHISVFSYKFRPFNIVLNYGIISTMPN